MKNTIKKIPLYPNGVSHSIEPSQRPTFNEWAKEFNCIEKKQYFDYEEDSIESLHHQRLSK